MSAISQNSILQSLLQKNTDNSASSGASTNQSLTQILAQAQGTNLSTGNSASGSSYLLDLSPAAQAYLSNMNSDGTSSSQNSSTSSNGNGIILSPLQQGKLTAILNKYKDAPYNDTTFKQIQQDMSDAGIGADSLAAKNQMRHINVTSMLLDALNGGDGSTGTIGGAADLAHSELEFMSRVNDQWKAISTTAGDAELDDDSVTGAS